MPRRITNNPNILGGAASAAPLFLANGCCLRYNNKKRRGKNGI
jgi:hypothetical protein